MTKPAIVAQGVTKRYRRFAHKNQLRTLKSALLTGSVLADLKPEETFTALEDVSFEVRQGSTFAVIGENGSGKSTLLKLVAGITQARRTAALTVDGRISALIELGAGFHPEISGRENVGDQRHDAGAHAQGARALASTRSWTSRSCGTSSTRRSRPTRRACTCGSASRSRSTSTPTCC